VGFYEFSYILMVLILDRKEKGMDINLFVVLPLTFLGMVYWVGTFVYMLLKIMSSAPNEIQFRKDAGESMGILPRKINEISK